MHHHRLHARLFEHDDVAGEAFGKLRVDHGVAAIFDDHRRLIVALHIGQRLGEDVRRDAGLSEALVEVFVGSAAAFFFEVEVVGCPENTVRGGEVARPL